MPENQPLPSPTTVALDLAAALDNRKTAYALGGAIALGYWAEPRGTMDVDLTLFLNPEKHSECIWLLQDIGCDVPVGEAIQLLQEHGFCRATYSGLRVDVFFPTIPFYETAKARRRQVPLRESQIMVWDAETLAVFKMMFFREKDLLDLKQVLRKQGSAFDVQWVHQQLVDICGSRDTRTARWDEIVRESKA
jgi:hypothetical protein